MRRFVTLAVLLLFSLPFGISITGCHKGIPVTYCNGSDSGPIVGQIMYISLQPALTGLSLNQGQIGQVPAAIATDCKGNTVSISNYTFSSSNTSLLDIQPSTGRLCAGVWNRNTGPVADYTYCTPNGESGVADVYAQIGATSNPLPVFVHPTISSIVLGPPSTDCIHDPATNCSTAALLAASSSATLASCNIDPASGCCTTPPPLSGTPYNFSCVSQGNTVQLAARAYSGGNSATNISCLVGHLNFVAQTGSIVTVDQNGVATAQQPGSTLMSANTSVSQGGTSSSAGYFSTCPPANISLTVPGTGASDPTNIILGQNTFQPLVAVVKDSNGVTLSGLTLTYNTTTPATISVSETQVRALYPGVSDITAVCMPPTCNPAPINEVGLNGNGTPLTSNPVTVTTPGTLNTVLYIASTQSLYVLPVDFTNGGTIGSPVRLPFVPNSVTASPDKSILYFGSNTELMMFSTANSSVSREDNQVSGKVIAVSPDDTTLVISDPVRQIIYLYTVNASASSGTIAATYGGVASSASWSPDSQTVYIDAVDTSHRNMLLVHSSFSGWTTTALPVPSTSVTTTVPSIGAYLSGTTTTGVSYCPSSVINSTATPPPTTASAFYPISDVSAAMTDQVTATNDGRHILGANASGPSLVDMQLTLPVPTSANPNVSNVCPYPTLTTPATVGPGYFQSTYTTQPIPGITATSITGVDIATDTSLAYVTYTGTGGVLPAYIPSTSGAGTLSEVTLLNGTSPAPASVVPVAGVFSTDNKTFYAGTAGDDKVHVIVNQTDTGAITPNLPLATGSGAAVPDLIVQKPKTII